MDNTGDCGHYLLVPRSPHLSSSATSCGKSRRCSRGRKDWSSRLKLQTFKLEKDSPSNTDINHNRGDLTKSREAKRDCQDDNAVAHWNVSSGVIPGQIIYN